MAKSFTIANTATAPTAAEYARCGGGLITAIDCPVGLAGTDYDCEYYSEDEAAWQKVRDEAGAARQIQPGALGGMIQISPAIFAPKFRLISDLAETEDQLFRVYTL